MREAKYAAPGLLPSVFTFTSFLPERGDDMTPFHVRTARPSLTLSLNIHQCFTNSWHRPIGLAQELYLFEMIVNVLSG